MPRGGSKPGERRGGRKKGTPNKFIAKLQDTLAKAAQQYDSEALQTLVDIMNDATATAASRVRCAEMILERGHGKPAPWQEQKSEVAPFAERIEWYMKRDEYEASADKVVQLIPPGKHDGKD